jgi:hypothetical protein
MDKTRLKQGIALGGVLVGVPLLLLAFLGLSNFIASFNQGADPASIFRGHALVIPAPDQARYVPNADFRGRTPTQAQREELLSAYWRGWEALARAGQTGDPADLPTYWAGSALAFAREAVTDGSLVVVASRGHQVRLTYLSGDGSLATLVDDGFTLETPVGPRTVTATATLTLDNGFWRVRQLRLDY